MGLVNSTKFERCIYVHCLSIGCWLDVNLGEFEIRRRCEVLRQACVSVKGSMPLTETKRRYYLKIIETQEKQIKPVNYL